MVDFTSPIPKYSALRSHKLIENMTDYNEAVEDFLETEFLAVNDRAIVSQSFTSVVTISKGTDGVVAKIRIDTKDPSINGNFLTETVKAAYVQALAGAAATGAHNVDSNNWKTTLKGVTEDGDEFRLLIDEKLSSLYDYSVDPATRNTIEAWADTVDALSEPPAN